MSLEGRGSRRFLLLLLACGRSFDQPRAFLFLGYSSPAALRAGSLRSLLSQLTAIIQILRPPTFPSTDFSRRRIALHFRRHL
ncbi:hypothetical protein PMIN06_007106 [Paraphaeosphaeria minitans]